MTAKNTLPLLLSAAILISGCATTAVQQGGSRVDTVFVAFAAGGDQDLSDVKAGPFDMGKMWTFDHPPVKYFSKEHGVDLDGAWFAKARAGALRLSNCSASFVSPNGLVLTNHHCARVAVTQVTRSGEDLAKDGFYASDLDQERKIPGFYADQLTEITDVTSLVMAASEAGATEIERASLRQSVIAEIQTNMAEAAGGAENGFRTQVISLYSGSIYSAYTFKRYEDVRLVQSPELALGFFGGNDDNFTYPRYSLDMSFLRVYKDGRPLRTKNYFPFSEQGSSEGEPIFVVGNPGSTNRLQTVSQLTHRAEHEDPILLRLYKSRARAMEAFKLSDPAAAREIDLQNKLFSFENTIKARTGILGGLKDPVLMARKADAEATFRNAIAADDSLNAKYGTLFEEMAGLQKELGRLANHYGAFILNPASTLYAGTTKRAALAYLYAASIEAGADVDQMAGARQEIIDLVPYPKGLEQNSLTERIQDLIYYLGSDHPGVIAILKDRSPADAAAEIVQGTALLDPDRLETAIDSFLTATDPAYNLGALIGSGLVGMQQRRSAITGRIAEISEDLARARFEVFGTDFPPDATFSLRISDGVVKGYRYNGTVAPPYTTFYGLYDRHYSHDGVTDWDLPRRWTNHPADFDLSTPLTFVSTNDIIGGNSGSPVLNAKLEIVGLAFDGNMENLPGEFIYTDEKARMMSVDSRGILEALDKIYDADRIVLELLRGDLLKSEREADTILEGTQEVRPTVRGRRRF